MSVRLTFYHNQTHLLSHPQGKVHNPSGEGVRAVSSQVQQKTQAKLQPETTTSTTTTTTADSNDPLATKTKEGTSKRNILRKKNHPQDSKQKKQGGHGKGEWKELLVDYSADPDDTVDPEDPLYDVAEDSQRFVLTSTDDGATHQGQYDDTTQKAIYGPLWTLPEFKRQSLIALLEYFDSADAPEVLQTLQELSCRAYFPHLPKYAISLAMDQGPRERELTSRLLTCLETIMSRDEVAEGFVLLLDGMDDLVKDVPDAMVRVVC